MADLEEAIRVCQTAVQRTPPDSPDLPAASTTWATASATAMPAPARWTTWKKRSASSDRRAAHAARLARPARNLNNLGNGLSDRYARTGALADLEEARERYRAACKRGLEVSPEEALRSARNWGNWALQRRDWQEATEAYAYGRQAIDLLFATQTSRAAKESWLREAQGLPANAAYALARLDKLEEAVVALEAGRARLLAEALEQNRRDLERLPELGHGELLERYRQAAGRIQFLQQQAGQRAEQREQQPASSNLAQEMAAARAELDAAIAAIRQVEVDGQKPYADFWLPPTFEKIQKAAAPGAPLVYLMTTPAGSLALVVAGDKVEPLWMDGLNEARLREVLVWAGR